MAEQFFATKGNLVKARHTLQLCKLGYELMDQKRNVLIRELMQLLDQAKQIRGEIAVTYQTAYQQLQEANITMGMISQIADAVPTDQGVHISFRSVMGVELPSLTLDKPEHLLPYGFYDTNTQLDEAYLACTRAKLRTLRLAELDSSIFRLAVAIKKTQRRANALKNILIPRYENAVHSMTLSLEEKERESFSRLKVQKVQKRKKAADEGKQ